MEELGFTPSPAARRLSLGRTLTIGVVVSFLTRPQAAERLRGVDVVLTDSEFDLVIYNVESVQKRDHYLGTLAQSQRTDGLLVMSLPPNAESRARCSAARPFPWCSSTSTRLRSRRLPRVDRRRRAGGALAARHLLDLGHRDIGFIGDAMEDPFGSPRAAIARRGSPVELARAGGRDPGTSTGHGAHGRYEARDLARRMLTAVTPARPPSSPPATRRLSGSSRPRGNSVCTYRTTYRSSATTTSRRPSTSGLTTNPPAAD